MSNKIDLALMPKQITVLRKDHLPAQIKKQKKFYIKSCRTNKNIYIYRFGGIG